MSIGKFIAHNKNKTLNFLRKNGVKVSPKDTYYDLSDKFHDFGYDSSENAKKIDAFISGNSSSFLGFVSQIFGSEKTREQQQAQKDAAHAEIMNELTREESSSKRFLVPMIAIIMLAVIVSLWLVSRKN